MSEAAEHRSRDCAQYHARAKSQPGRLGTGRNGKGQSDHAKDGNGPGVHDRSPADCRTSLDGRVWQSAPPATRLGTTRCRSLVLDCPKHRVIMRGRSIPFPARPAKLARLPMLETVPRLADCNEAKLSNFNQCCFSAAQDRAARGWRKPLLNRAPFRKRRDRSVPIEQAASQSPRIFGRAILNKWSANLSHAM